MNAICHPILFLEYNKIDRQKKEFNKNVITKDISKKIEGLEEERKQIILALGGDYHSFLSIMYGYYLEYHPTIYSFFKDGITLNKMPLIPNGLYGRYLYEDIFYLLRDWISIGDSMNLELPITNSLVNNPLIKGYKNDYFPLKLSEFSQKSSSVV
jgi:hypothetical protein